MSKFISSFNKALENADDIIRQRDEINEVLADLNSEISEATEGIISIEKRGENHPALYAISEEEIDLLTYIYTGRNGAYPCILQYAGTDAEALDKETLILNLQNLISTERVGLIFRKLLDRGKKNSQE